MSDGRDATRTFMKWMVGTPTVALLFCLPQVCCCWGIRMMHTFPKSADEEKGDFVVIKKILVVLFIAVLPLLVLVFVIEKPIRL